MKRILAVDDEPTMTLLIKLSLESTGAYEVFTENQASHAVETARECHPDLILMDIMMPDMLGSEVAAILKEDPALKDIKVVFLTSLLKKCEEKQYGEDIGRQRIIAKPLSTEELVAVIEQELGEETPARPRGTKRPARRAGLCPPGIPHRGPASADC